MKNVNKTSIEAYRSLNLGERQRQVLDVLKMRSMTNKEIGRKLNLQLCSITGRVKELREAGLVTSMGKVVCPESGKKVNVWRVTQFWSAKP